MINLKNIDIKTLFEWFGVTTAVIYSLLIASNTGNEVIEWE